MDEPFTPCKGVYIQFNILLLINFITTIYIQCRISPLHRLHHNCLQSVQSLASALASSQLSIFSAESRLVSALTSSQLFVFSLQSCLSRLASASLQIVYIQILVYASTSLLLFIFNFITADYIQSLTSAQKSTHYLNIRTWTWKTNVILVSQQHYTLLLAYTLYIIAVKYACHITASIS